VSATRIHEKLYANTGSTPAFRFLLVERARLRQSYPRPWGFSVESEPLVNEPGQARAPDESGGNTGAILD
jgi:hypothetical protein